MSQTPPLPQIIQGGMGVSISGWRLARAVSMLGQLGVVSGTGIDTVMVRRLQLGDPEGVLRRAFDAFPIREIAERVWSAYFVQGGKAADKPFKSKPMPSVKPSRTWTDLLVLSNFVEVFLAKEGHDGLVGINLLEKIQIPTMASLYGAMLAGVDYVLMGAGIPRQVPAILDAFARGEAATYQLDVSGAQAGDHFSVKFEPTPYGGAELKRPQFLAIVSAAPLAVALAKRSTGQVNGFIIEHHSAGGHNAGPRGEMRLDETGQPIYGERDTVDLEAMNKLGLPFWLAGSRFGAGILEEAKALGAEGVQIGTAFAFCEESGMHPFLKHQARELITRGQPQIFTDPNASPTGFPFKVMSLEGTLSQPEIYDARVRLCDLGYLRELYRKEDGNVGYRCPGEPIEDFVSKGGEEDKTVGRKCICNGLLATTGLAQTRKNGYREAPIVTSGDSWSEIRQLLNGKGSYAAQDVLQLALR